MEKINHACFVCKKPLSGKNIEINKEVYLPVCLECKGTDAEKKNSRRIPG
jgi:ribosome-binding protein aMBF1 (putative translation factor)